MSVRKDSYIVYVWRMPYDLFSKHYDALEPYFPKGGYGKPFTFHDDFTVIFDGMSGNWVVVGKVLHVADAHGDFGGQDGITLLPPGVEPLVAAALNFCLHNFVQAQGIGLAAYTILDAPPALMLVEHYH